MIPHMPPPAGSLRSTSQLALLALACSSTSAISSLRRLLPGVSGYIAAEKKKVRNYLLLLMHLSRQPPIIWFRYIYIRFLLHVGKETKVQHNFSAASYLHQSIDKRSSFFPFRFCLKSGIFFRFLRFELISVKFLPDSYKIPTFTDLSKLNYLVLLNC